MPNATIFLFDLVVGNDFEMPQYVIETYEINNFSEQTNDSGIFNEMDVIECFCKVGSVPYLDDKMTNNYGANYYNFA